MLLVDITAVLPELMLVLGGMVLIMAEVFAPQARPAFAAAAAAFTIAAAAFRLAGELPGEIFSGALRLDDLARYVDVYVLAALLLAILLAHPYLRRTGARFGEFYALLLWAGAGAMVMAKGDHLLAVFIGLEMMSICLYALNAFHRDSVISLEAGWKYLVVGAFATGFLLFGVSLLYGATGTLRLSAMAGTNAAQPLVLAALALILTGLGFKLALFPFHAWAPDVYQGSPTPATAFLSVVPKGAALVVLIRLAAVLRPDLATPRWVLLLAAIAAASMTIGNLVAIAQRDLKRMLAYSGIAHMGYALVGVAAFGAQGASAVLVYLAAYTLMNMAAFGVVSAFSESEDEPHLITDLAGQSRQRPFLSFVLALAMISLAGIPPTLGFAAKFLVFRAAVNETLVWLAVVGVLNSLISVFYYVRVIYYLYMKPLPKRPPEFLEPWSVRFAGALCAAGIVAAGIVPRWLIEAAEAAVRTLVR